MADRVVDLGGHGLPESTGNASEKAVEGVVDLFGLNRCFEYPAASFARGGGIHRPKKRKERGVKRVRLAGQECQEVRAVGALLWTRGDHAMAESSWDRHCRG